MSACPGCNRVLSANGACLYCGTQGGRSAVEGGVARRGKRWLRKILLLVLAALLAHFFFFSPTGKGLVRSLLETTGLSKHVNF